MSDGSQRTWLIRQCENLRQTVEARDLASKDEIERAWPEDDADDREWIKCYGTFRAWRWADHLYSGKLEAEDQVRAALLDEPKRVHLTGGIASDEPDVRQHVVEVYPKSFTCLLWFRERDWTLAWLNSWLADLKKATADGTLQRTIADPAKLREDIVTELAHQMSMIVGCCISDGERLPDPVEPVEVSPVDFYLIHQAFTEVNTMRLGALERICPPTGGKGDTGWNIFFGTMSQKLGKPASELMRNQSLASLIAESRLAIPDMGDALAGH